MACTWRWVALHAIDATGRGRVLGKIQLVLINNRGLDVASRHAVGGHLRRELVQGELGLVVGPRRGRHAGLTGARVGEAAAGADERARRLCVYQPANRDASAWRRAVKTSTASPPRRRRADGVRVDATIPRDVAVKLWIPALLATAGVSLFLFLAILCNCGRATASSDVAAVVRILACSSEGVCEW